MCFLWVCFVCVHCIFSRTCLCFRLFAVCACVCMKACVCPGMYACMHMCALACVRVCVCVSVSLGSVQVKELQEERGQGLGTVAMLLSTGLSPPHPPPPISAPCACTISAALACLLSVILMESERESPGWGNPPGKNNCFTSLVLMAAKAMPGMHTVH